MTTALSPSATPPPPSNPSSYLLDWEKATGGAKPVPFSPESSPLKSKKQDNPIDLQFRTGNDMINLFFKRTPKEEQEKCIKIPLSGGYGFALEQDEKVVILQLWEEKLACHSLEPGAPLKGQFPMAISWKYDSVTDGLIIYLVDPDYCKGLRNSVIAEDHFYGTNLILRCNEEGLLFCISVLSASEYLPQAQ